jgi:hypothetical protein
MYSGDIVIHIDENLEDDVIHALERDLSDERGVYSACVPDKTRHLMLVDFDASMLQPSRIVHAIRGKGLTAEMVGL